MKDYIEREAALAICEKEYNERIKMADWCGDTVAWNIGGAIKGLPAADVAPIRHAHWFDVGSLSCRCSGCGCKSERETAYCPNCGAKMQPVGNPDILNTPQTHADAIKKARVQSNKEETHMYIKKFRSILDVISHELSDEDLIRWVSQRAMESEANSREVAEMFGYECE